MEHDALERMRRGNARFEDQEIRQIREAGRQGKSRIERAREWGCGVATIANIDRGVTYSWVEQTGKTGRTSLTASEQEKQEIAESLARVLAGRAGRATEGGTNQEEQDHG